MDESIILYICNSHPAFIPEVLMQESVRMCKDGKNGEWFGSATFVYNRARSSLKLASKTKNKFHSSNMYLIYLESQKSEVSGSLVRFTVPPFMKKL